MFAVSGCTAIITGASSGLGAEFARQLAGRAACLVLAARSADKLREVAEGLPKTNASLRVVTVSCDLATDAGRATLWERVESEGLGATVNLLINNAGHGDYGDFAAGDIARARSQIDLNITSLTVLTHAFLARVLATGKPAGILNVSSLASVTPIPDLTVYAATKAYVTSFSEGLAMELAERGVTVQALCPGPTPTNFSMAARRADGKDADRGGQDLLKIPPSQVVAEGLRGLEAGKRRVFPGLGVRIAAFCFETMPRWLLRLLLNARYQRSKKVA